jgi:reverse gyrase
MARAWKEYAATPGRCHRCGGGIEAERVALKLTRCRGCARKDAAASKRRRDVKRGLLAALPAVVLLAWLIAQRL